MGKNDGNDGLNSGATVQSELERLDREAANKSLLRKAIDFATEPYHQESAARQKLLEAANGGGNATEAVKASQRAAQAESDAYIIGSGAIKTAGLFVKGKFGFATTAAAYMLDEVRPNNNHVAMDATLGLAKGIGMRTVLSKVAGGQQAPAMMALQFGTASRFVDSALTRQNYVDAGDNLTLSSFGNGLLKVGATTFNPVALGSDVATAGFAHGLTKMAPTFFAGNTFRSMTTMTFANGWANGMAQEGHAQFQKGQFDAGRLAAFPLASALATSLSAAPGNQRRYVDNYGLENAATIRNREFKLVAIDASDVRNIARGGKNGAEVSIKPIAEGLARGDAETIQVRRQNVPTDWISSISGVFGKGKIGPAGEQLRFVSREGGDPKAPWEMTINSGTKTISELIKSNSDYYQGQTLAPFVRDLHEPLRAFLGSGSESGAFRMANGGVLKTASSTSSDKISNWGKLPGDAQAMFSPLRLNVLKGYGEGHSILVQEPLRTPVKEFQAAALREQMQKDGIHFWDYNYRLMGDQVSNAVDQVGINALGKPVILDYGARRPSFDYKPPDAHKITDTP
jgi:hypothetical protein